MNWKKVRSWTYSAVLVSACVYFTLDMRQRAFKQGLEAGYYVGYIDALEWVSGELKRAPLPDAPAVFARPSRPEI